MNYMIEQLTDEWKKTNKQTNKQKKATNERILDTCQISRTGASSSDAI